MSVDLLIFVTITRQEVLDMTLRNTLMNVDLRIIKFNVGSNFEIEKNRGGTSWDFYIEVDSDI